METSLLMDHFNSKSDSMPRGIAMEVMKNKKICCWTIYFIDLSFPSLEKMRC